MPSPEALRTPAVPARLLLEIDQVCEDFEHAWLAGQSPRIEDYLPRMHENTRPLLREELVRIELEWRFRRDDTPSAEDYLPRFPELMSQLGDWLRQAETDATSFPLRRTA